MKKFGPFRKNEDENYDDIFGELDDVDASELDDIDLSDIDISDLDAELEYDDDGDDERENDDDDDGEEEYIEQDEYVPMPESEEETVESEEEYSEEHEEAVPDDSGDRKKKKRQKREKRGKIKKEEPDEYTEAEENAPEENEDTDEDIFGFEDEGRSAKNTFITGICLAVVIALSAFIARTNTGIIGAFKDNLSYNISRIEQATGLDKIFGGSSDTKTKHISNIGQVTFGKETNIIPFEDAESAQFRLHGNNIIAAKSNYLAMYDKNGKIVWENITGIVNPILCVNGNYILIAENGGRKICLYRDDKQIYSVDAQNNIVSASVSLTGDCVVVTRKDFYKGAFEAFNKSGACIYSWSSGKDYIVCAAISPATRDIAVAFVNTDERVESHIQIFDINRSGSHTSVNFGETAVFGLEYNKSVLTAYSDCSICGLDRNGELLWRHMYENGNKFISYSSDVKGNKLILTENNDKPELHIYNTSGKEKHVVPIDELADCIGINGRCFIFNNSRTITFGHISSMNHCAASMEIKGLYVLDGSRCMVVYSNSIEFIKA